MGIILLPQIVKPKSIDKVLSKAKVGNVRIDEMKIKVYSIIGMFREVLYERIVL